MEKYSESLDIESKKRYDEKLVLTDGVDPYKLGKAVWSVDALQFPAINFIDMVNYLVHSSSPFSHENMRCYKGLAAYNQFVCGWVRDVMVYKCSSKQKVSIIRGRVMHSQRLNDTALSPWIIAEHTGDIKAAHCNCMAGLGEVCTHVASLLFYVESAVRLREQSTVTASFPYWKLPESKKSVTYAKLNDIDFTSAKTKKRKLDESLNCQVNTPSTSVETDTQCRDS